MNVAVVTSETLDSNEENNTSIEGVEIKKCKVPCKPTCHIPCKTRCKNSYRPSCENKCTYIRHKCKNKGNKYIPYRKETCQYKPCTPCQSKKKTNKNRPDDC